MALAIIEFEEYGRSGVRFRIDIGKNDYYSYAIGGEDTTRQNGIDLLLDPAFVSPVLGPLAPSANGRGIIDVPPARFDGGRRRVQLASFRDRDKSGPAISGIVAVSTVGPAFEDLPPPALFAEPRAFAAAARSRAVGGGAGVKMTTTRVENVPYNYQRAQSYSSAMFLEAITSLLPQILPALAPLLGGLLGGGGGTTAAPSPNVLATLGNPETIKAITDLVKQISGAKALGTRVVYRTQEGRQAAAFALTGHRHQFSNAMIAPALLAALPALMPIIEKVLNPETMKAIMENVSPAKLVGTVSESIANFAKLGMEGDKQLQEHLERLNPGVKNPELYRLLESLSTGEARAGSRLTYRRVDGVKLALVDTAPQTLYGRSRLAYRCGQDLSFPVDVQTPRPLRHATLEVSLKEAGTLRLLYEKRHTVDEVPSGPLKPLPTIPWGSLSRLRPGEDYMLTLALSWSGKSGPKRGTSVSQLITLVNEYAFDRVEGASPELVPLGDLDRDREFWHRAWDHTFQERGLTRLRFSCEYCYVLDDARASNARMDTKETLESGEASNRRMGQLRSGMVLSADSLNRLIPRVSGDASQTLSEAQLEALRSPDFVDRFNQTAQAQVDFKGRRGENVALWVYPEIQLRQVVLKRVSSTDEHGHVREFEEETVPFPIPAMVHLVGTSSADDGGTPEVDGLRVAFDKKVGLYPANLQKKVVRSAPTTRRPTRSVASPFGYAYAH